VHNRIKNYAQCEERIFITNPEDFKTWNDYLLSFNEDILLKIQDWLKYGEKYLLPQIHAQQVAIQEYYNRLEIKEKDCFSMNNKDMIKPKKYIIPKHPIEETLEMLIKQSYNKSVENPNKISFEDKFQRKSKKNQDKLNDHASNTLNNSSKEENYINLSSDLTEKFELDPLFNSNSYINKKANNPKRHTESFLKKKIRVSSENKKNESCKEAEDKIQFKRRKIESQIELQIEIKTDCIDALNSKEKEIEFLLDAWKSDYSANPVSTDFNYPYYNEEYIAIDDEYAHQFSLNSKNIDYKEYYVDNKDKSFEEKEKVEEKEKEKVKITQSIQIGQDEEDYEKYIHTDKIIINNTELKSEFEKFNLNYFLNKSNQKICTCKYSLVRIFLTFINQELNEKNIFLTWGFKSFRTWLKGFLSEQKNFLICSDHTCENRKSNILCNINTCSFFRICGNKINASALKIIKNHLVLCKKGLDQKTALFTRIPIKTGEFLIEFTGELITINQISMLEKSLEQKEKIRKLNDYFYLDSSRKGNLSRFINSSNNPNCKTINCFKRISKNKVQFYLMVYAIKQIGIDEEITLESYFK